MDYCIGIDVGTSGVKCLLVNVEGEIAGSASMEYKPDFLGNGFVEQDPSVWWNSTKAAIKVLLDSNSYAKGKVVALSTSGQMHSCVFLDNEYNSIRKSILWNDTRTTAQTKQIYEKVGGKENLLNMTANLALEGFSLPKILWLKDNEPENFNKINKVVMPKDYINFMLTGELVTEVSDAAGTLMFDVKNSCWSKELLEKVNIDISILPKVINSTDVVGIIKEDLYQELGLARNAKIIAGGADNSCAAVGNGAVDNGDVVISVGTSGTVIGYLDKIDKEITGAVHLFNYSVPNSFYAMGCMLSAGQSLKWLKHNVLSDMSYDEINNLAVNSPVGSRKLIFLPYLFGERSPHNDPNARGVFFGLSGETEPGDLIRAVMEGVAFGLKDLYIQVQRFTEPKDVYITGGGAKSLIWGQIISDVLNVPLKILDISEGPSFGAALIALKGAGICNEFKTSKVAKIIYPSNNVSEYEKIYPLYQKLYRVNKEIFEENLKL